MKSENINELVAALIKAQAVIEQPKKNAKNPHFKSMFADLSACFDAVRKPLNDSGLVVSQIVMGDELHTLLLHTSGQWLCSRYPIAPAQNTPQGVGSAITFAKRYALCAMLGLVGDVEDDDGNAASKKAAEKAEAPAAPSYLGELASALEAAKTGADIDAIEKTFSAKPLTFAMRRQVTELLQKARTKVQ